MTPPRLPVARRLALLACVVPVLAAGGAQAVLSPQHTGPAGPTAGPEVALTVAEQQRMTAVVDAAVADGQEFWAKTLPAEFGVPYRPGGRVAAGTALAGIWRRFGDFGLVQVVATDLAGSVRAQLGAPVAGQAECLSASYARHLADGRSGRFRFAAGDELARMIAALAATGTPRIAALARVSAFGIGYRNQPRRCVAITEDDLRRWSPDVPAAPTATRVLDAAGVSAILGGLAELFGSRRLPLPKVANPETGCGAGAVRLCTGTHGAAVQVNATELAAATRTDRTGFAAATRLALGYAAAAVRKSGAPPAGATIRVHCIVGAWTKWALERDRQLPLVRSAAGLDTAVTEVLLAEPDRTEPGAPSALARLEAFRAGLADGLGSCGSQNGTGPAIGVTHTQYSLDSWESQPQRQGGERVLSGVAMPQNQHIMGWGVGNPEPAPGGYDWSRLDERMALIERTGGTPVITLCCAPDWMKGGRAGQTDWSRLTDAPRREHYADFAALAAEVAKRYPKVRHFQVWNELKGFWNATDGRWDYESFTDFYNLVYEAVKTARPDALVGGPYVPMDLWSGPDKSATPSGLRGPWGVVDQRALDVVEYWLRHKRGADFVTIDAGTGTKDRGLVTDPLLANDAFAVITRWLAERSGLPVWWSEFYPDLTPVDLSADRPERVGVTLDAVAKAVAAGAATMLLWQPQQGDGQHHAALWTAPSSGGTRAAPLAEPWMWLARTLPLGGTTVSRSSDHAVVLFDSPEGVLAVNLTGTEQRVELLGAEVALAGHGTRIARH